MKEKNFAALLVLIAFTGCQTAPRHDEASDQLPNHFQVSGGGALGGFSAVELEGDHLRCTDAVGPSFAHQHAHRVAPTREAWVAFWREVQAVDLWRWQSSYKVPPPNVVFDGLQWSVEIDFQGQSIRSSGDNAFPADGDAQKTGSDVAMPTKRYLRFIAAVDKLVGRRDGE